MQLSQNGLQNQKELAVERNGLTKWTEIWNLGGGGVVMYIYMVEYL